MSFAQLILAQAKEKQRNLVFPEGSDERVLAATIYLISEGIASSIMLLGDLKDIMVSAERMKVENTLAGMIATSKVIVESSFMNADFSDYAQKLYEIRKHKGLSLSDAEKLVHEPLNFASLLVRERKVHGMVAGSVHTTADVLRSVIRIIGASDQVKTISSFFLMESDDTSLGSNGAMIFSDCAIVIQPSVEELSYIAYSSAQSCISLLKAEPRIAMLSFSTKGSAAHEEATRIADATNLVKEKYPSLVIDGEMQFDTAIVKDIAYQKAPSSPIQGNANVFIFPDISSGNIGYKIAQRLGGCRAYGPFIQGLAAPVSDLSRGCSVQDIVITSAVVLAQDC